MNKVLHDGWFTEFSPLWPGQALSLEIESILFDAKSEFQHILIFQSKTYGKVLVLDGAIQLTERDEYSYQEMIAHLPLLSHPCPKKVCVIGGGDGAVLRQIIKHKSVEEIHLCEIDQLVIEKSREHFPQFCQGFNDPRVKIIVQDGAQYLANLPEPYYDIVIVDSSDPIGPALALFEESFYSIVAQKALRRGGIVCTQSECLWIHLELIKKMVKFCKELYSSVEYAVTSIPTYPSGQIGFLICTHKDTDNDSEHPPTCRIPKRTPEEAFVDQNEVNSLRYYHSKIHSSCFILPRFASDLQV